MLRPEPWHRAFQCLALACWLALSISCARGPEPVEPTPTASPLVHDNESIAAKEPVDVWWNTLADLCGNAYGGAMVSDDAVDADFGAQSMVMHVRRCAPDRIEIPFQVGENKSRTWVLTRTGQGIQLQHDHRHEDGSADEVTLYGGHTDELQPGDATAQHFPADDYSKQLFLTTGLDASVDNTWTMEIHPGKRFSYILRRPQRYFQVDFDLSQTVETPSPPWGED